MTASALPIAVVTPAVAYLTGRVRPQLVSDADHLMLAELLPSLASGSGVDDWTIPLANYAVPDWPLYAIALTLGRSPTGTIAYFMILQTALLAAAAHTLIRSFDRSAPMWAAAVPVAIVLTAASTEALPSVYVGASYNHFGTVILAVFALSATLRWLENRSGRALLTATALTAAAVFSDRIFVIWFLVPAAVAIAVAWIRGRIDPGRAALWSAANVCSAVIALVLSDLIVPSRTEYAVSFGRGGLLQRVLDLGHLVKQDLASGRLQALLVMVLTALVAVQLMRRRSVVGQKLDPTASEFTLSFLIAVVPSVTAGLALLNGGVQPHVRHYSVLFLYPLVVGSAVSTAGVARLQPALDPQNAAVDADRPTKRAAMAVVVAVVVAPFAAAIAEVSVDRSTVPITCIEAVTSASGSRRGIASYWDARPIEVFSEGRLDVASVTPLLLHDPTNADLTEFSRTYDFAVTSSTVPQWDLPLDGIVQRSGPPITAVGCGAFTVLDWGPSGLDLFPTDSLGEPLVFSGCILPSQLSEPDAECVLSASTDPPDGFLTYGPYVGLAPGVYRLEVDFRSPASPSTGVGTWEVILDGATETPAEAGELPGTAGRWKSQVVELDLQSAASRTTAELRVDPSRHPIDVAAVRVERLR